MSATKTATKKSAKGPKNATKAKADSKPKRTSAIDAAAKVLDGAKEAMTCKELIEAMAAKGYWSSPGGKTPHATLYTRDPAGDQREGQRRPVQEDRARQVRAGGLTSPTFRPPTPHVRHVGAFSRWWVNGPGG